MAQKNVYMHKGSETQKPFQKCMDYNMPILTKANELRLKCTNVHVSVYRVQHTRNNSTRLKIKAKAM